MTWDNCTIFSLEIGCMVLIFPLQLRVCKNLEDLSGYQNGVPGESQEGWNMYEKLNNKCICGPQIRALCGLHYSINWSSRYIASPGVVHTDTCCRD